MTVQPHQADSRRVVAVIDDDPAVCNSLKFLLELEGFTVRLYGSAEELLSDSSLRDLSCLIVDQVMPAMSGLDMVAQLRRLGILAPAILVTSRPSAVLRTRAESAGIPIVEKPLLGNTLVDEVRLMTGSG